ncbi:MAG: hypothetical protein SFW66_06950 [Gammaproteobacteria bacterium]|nr:hypothetical protein [Gammaproteobacteria bacterium]
MSTKNESFDLVYREDAYTVHGTGRYSEEDELFIGKVDPNLLKDIEGIKYFNASCHAESRDQLHEAFKETGKQTIATVRAECGEQALFVFYEKKDQTIDRSKKDDDQNQGPSETPTQHN